MIDEAFTDAQRRYLLQLAMNAVPNTAPDSSLLDIISRLSGTDTVLIARRAYPSRGSRRPDHHP